MYKWNTESAIKHTEIEEICVLWYFRRLGYYRTIKKQCFKEERDNVAKNTQGSGATQTHDWLLPPTLSLWPWETDTCQAGRGRVGVPLQWRYGLKQCNRKYLSLPRWYSCPKLIAGSNQNKITGHSTKKKKKRVWAWTIQKHQCHEKEKTGMFFYILRDQRDVATKYNTWPLTVFWSFKKWTGHFGND